MSYIADTEQFKHIVRLLNTNIDGRSHILHSLTNVKGIGRRMATAIIKMSGVDGSQRAGMLTDESLNKLKAVAENPTHFGIPDYFLNNRRDFETGKDEHILSNNLAQKMRLRMDRLKKIKCIRGIRHFLGYKVRGQRMKANGRRRPQQKLGILKSGKRK